MTKSVAVLYKQSKTGKTQSWEIQVEDNKYRSISGEVGGKLTVGAWTICDGKNIGRANETTPEEQALAEAEAKATKKCDGGYGLSSITKNTAKFFEPMLAKEWKDLKDKLVYPVYVQPKLDGMRCIITKDGMTSRNGKAIVSAPHIFEALNKFFEQYPDMILDGELYNHSLKADFNKIMSLAKKTKPTADELVESEKMIEYHCYDMFFVNEPKAMFTHRTECIKSIVDGGKYLKKVPTLSAFDEKEVDKLHAAFCEAGYEGSIIRTIHSVYENKRSKFLLKRKDFMDSEYTILDVIEGVGGRTGTAGSMVFKNKDGREFNSNIKGDFEYLAELWNDRKNLIGKLATIKYFNLTPDNVPRFPFVIAIRDYE